MIIGNKSFWISFLDSAIYHCDHVKISLWYQTNPDHTLSVCSMSFFDRNGSRNQNEIVEVDGQLLGHVTTGNKRDHSKVKGKSRVHR